MLTLFPLLSFAVDKKVVESKLTNMRVQPSMTMTRFSFLLSSKTCGTMKYLPNPDRVLLDIEHTTKDFKVENVKLGGSNVLMFNSEELPNGSLRFTFNTKGKVKWNLQVLPYGKTQQIVLEEDIISPSAPTVKSK
jgi:hypothetical protein